MTVFDSLALIHTLWIAHVARTLARSEDVRVNIEEQLERFFNRILQAVETGDPTWIDSLLVEWVSAKTETDLSARALSLSEILNQMHMITFELAHEHLSDADALVLLQSVLPIFLHAFEFSARIEMERNIAHISQELEQANATLKNLDKSKSDFIAIAAHELKTPLTLIEGYGAMLRESVLDEQDSNRSTILLKGIDNGTRRLREIIDDMIDVSLIDNHLLSLNFQPVWLDRILEVLRIEFASVVMERALILTVHSFPGCNEMTFGDEERLYQAFRNLFSNAIKFTPDGGRIEVNGRSLPGFLEIIFQDTGIGIAQEDLSKIFDKFGRLGKTSLHSSGKTKYKGGGPGLGLSIARGIIEAHGGSIWVESPGYDELVFPGSTFHVLLPLIKSPPDKKMAKLFHPLIEEDQVDAGIE